MHLCSKFGWKEFQHLGAPRCQKISSSSSSGVPVEYTLEDVPQKPGGGGVAAEVAAEKMILMELSGMIPIPFLFGEISWIR